MLLGLSLGLSLGTRLVVGPVQAVPWGRACLRHHLMVIDTLHTPPRSIKGRAVYPLMKVRAMAAFTRFAYAQVQQGSQPPLRGRNTSLGMP